MRLFVVIPCYNEEEVLRETTRRLKKKLGKYIKDGLISKDSRVMYVNDGSKDKTWDLICDINNNEELFTGICLARNVGHQNALMAGLMTAREYADAVISMDADLQDDIDAMGKMIEKCREGCDIVYGVRESRVKDSWFKRNSAQAFYKLMKLMGVDIVYNHADYRLATREVLDHLADYGEVNLFLRGIFPLMGFKSDVVYYIRDKRFAGESKYPLKKMINFAFDGITSFSVKPIRLILNAGVLISCLSVIMIVYSIVRKFMGQTVSGWSFIVCSLWFIGGVVMLSLGVVGEYIGKIYSEVKRRPRYIVMKNLFKD